MTAFIFPGQGSQAIGMGRSLAASFPVARAVFDEVDEALGEKLSSLIWDGSIEDLTLTRNAQPALMATSIAAVRVLAAETDLKIADAAFVAGHSLGEYSALCAVDSLSLADTAQLLRVRGDAMQAAVPVGEGAMAAILGLSLADVEAAIEAGGGGGVCQIANDNSPGQVVISGHSARVEAVMAAAKEGGAKRALPLPVSAPFHCTLMAPAAEQMAKALENADISPPVVPVIANVTAAPVTDPDAIRKLLIEQVTGRVRWTQSVETMSAAGVSRFVELGAGKVLSGLVKRINKQAETAHLGTVEDLSKF
ncbi:MAG: ACP S-malonyltransferase [Parvularculaceae bacterium]